MESHLEPIKVPRSLFWDLKLKRGRFNSAKDGEEWEDEEGISSGIGSSEYEQDSPPDLANQERQRSEKSSQKGSPQGRLGGVRLKERESGRDDLDEGVYCTSESDDQDLPHQLKDALMAVDVDDSCSNYSTETGPPGDEQHFNEFAETLRQQATKLNMQSVNGIPVMSPYTPSVLKVPQPSDGKSTPSSSSSATLSGMNNFNTASINLNMVPILGQAVGPTSASTTASSTATSVAPMVTFPVLNWPYRPVQCYQSMAHQIMPTTTSTWTGKPPPGLLYSEIVPPVFKKAIDIAAGAPSHIPVDMANKAPGYIPLSHSPRPMYPLASLIKTNEQQEEGTEKR